jgi:hypothetical protein
LAPVTKNGNPRILFFSEQTVDASCKLSQLSR